MKIILKSIKHLLIIKLKIMDKKISLVKLLLCLFLLLTVYLVINLTYLKSDKFATYIKSNFPKTDKTIFVVPSNFNLEKEFKSLLYKSKQGTSYFDTQIKSTMFLNFSEKKFFLDSYTYDSSRMKAVAFIEFFKDNIFIVSGDGKFSFFKNNEIPIIKKNNKTFLKPKNISSNIKDIIKDPSFYNIDRSIPFSHFNSVSDILVVDDYLYLSFNRVVKKDCYTKSIIRAKISLDFLLFEDFFFEKKECRDQIKDVKKYNGHQSGGRMIELLQTSKFNIFNPNNKKLLFTLGDFRSNRSKTIPDAQNLESIFGKKILIDIKTKEYKVFSSGHRNSQGILHDTKHDILLATEHGPYGGDEINNIKYEGNYGWPISSYGENYPRKPADKEKKFYFKKDHETLNFEEPIFAFTKSIGISEIIKVPDNFHEKWKDNYLVGSLNGQKLLRLKLDKNFQKILAMEIIHVGERIRDIKIKDDKIFMILENSPSFSIFTLK